MDAVGADASSPLSELIERPKHERRARERVKAREVNPERAESPRSPARLI